MNEEKKPVKKRKRRRLKIGYILSLVIIIFVVIFGLKMILPSSNSKYGDRLNGIKKITFGSKEKDKFLKSIKDNDAVSNASIDVRGRIITVTYNVKKELGLDDAKGIANKSLESLSNEVKDYYDVQFIVTKKDEEGRKEEGVEGEIKSFPIFGYRNGQKKHDIFWSNTR